MFTKLDKIIIICAHPDDEVMGCGGMIALARKHGVPVKVIFVFEGSSGRYNDKVDALTDIKLREQQAKDCLEILDVNDYVFLNYENLGVNNSDLLGINKQVQQYVDQFKPTIIVTHHDKDTNLDHTHCNKIAEVVGRPTSSVKKIYTFEIMCSTNYSLLGTFNPTTYLDISKVIDVKIKAALCYESEIKLDSSARSVEGIHIVSRFRGLQSNLINAEAFELKREVITINE